MKRSLLKGLCLGVCLLALPSWGMAQTLKFVVPEYHPFTGVVDGKPAGVGLETVDKILKKAGIPYSVKVVSNFARCILEVQNGSADGFFVGSKNAERDAVAVLSDKVLANKWLWIVPAASKLDPKSADFKAKAKVGVILSSNPHVWLKDNGYAISGTPADATSLLTMLDAKRYDAALVPELVLLDALKTSGKSAAAYKPTLQVEQAMGIYVSKTTLAANPGLMEKINAAIKASAP